MKKILLPAVLGLLVFVSGCTKISPEKEEIRAKTACILFCKIELQKGTDLSPGPCVSNDLLEDGKWVCDVAHSPREDRDNDPAYQCPAFGKTASRFVEVDPLCEFIRAV